MPQVKRAVCVGINYTGTSNALRGCVNDANDWATELEARGYTVVRVLDRAATRAAILAALAEAVAAVGWRGRGVFTYSGHGTFVPDVDGDEIDGFDEAIVPSDHARSGLITDDDLFTVLGERRLGSRWLTISDSCHSGTLSRAFGPTLHVPEGTAEEDLPRPRFMPPVDALGASHPDVQSATAQVAPTEQVIPRGTSRDSGVLMSGCDDPEYSYDAVFEGRPRGAFTAAALAALHSTRPPATYQDWHEQIRATLPSRAYPQSPQLQGSKSQRRWSVLS